MTQIFSQNETSTVNVNKQTLDLISVKHLNSDHQSQTSADDQRFSRVYTFTHICQVHTNNSTVFCSEITLKILHKHYALN